MSLTCGKDVIFPDMVHYLQLYRLSGIIPDGCHPMEIKDADAEWMAAFQQGDETVFEQLLDKYHRPIVNFIYKIVNNSVEAEELA